MSTLMLKKGVAFNSVCFTLDLSQKGFLSVSVSLYISHRRAFYPCLFRFISLTEGLSIRVCFALSLISIRVCFALYLSQKGFLSVSVSLYISHRRAFYPCLFRFISLTEGLSIRVCFISHRRALSVSVSLYISHRRHLYPCLFRFISLTEGHLYPCLFRFISLTEGHLYQCLFRFISLTEGLSIRVCFALYLSQKASLSVSVSLYISHRRAFYPCLFRFISLTEGISIRVCFALYLSQKGFHLYQCFCFALYLSQKGFLSVSVSLYISHRRASLSVSVSLYISHRRHLYQCLSQQACLPPCTSFSPYSSALKTCIN